HGEKLALFAVGLVSPRPLDNWKFKVSERILRLEKLGYFVARPLARFGIIGGFRTTYTRVLESFNVSGRDIILNGRKIAD
ncbi:hypothetical protein PHISCL_10807, partial [Aspergillus sclerotialis]